MKLSKALKEKNKKVKKLSVLSSRIAANNSFVKGKTPTYDARKLLEEYDVALEDLINFKTAIALTNAGIASKIIRMAELKSKISQLQYIQVTEGTQHLRHTEVTIEYESIINERERDELVEKAQEEIDTLQEEIDTYNATTELKHYKDPEDDMM